MKRNKFIIIIILLCSFSVYSQTENTLSTEEKIYELSLIWKEASYNFAFFDQVPNLNWDSCYQAFIPQVIATTNDWDYYHVLQRFMTLLHDGHTRLFPPAALRNKYYGTATKHIKTRLIENKVIITEVLDSTLDAAGIKKGMEIVKVDGLNVFEYTGKYVSPYMFASTKQNLTLETYGHFLLSGSVSKPVRIQVRDFNGHIRKAAIHRQPWLMEVEIFKAEPMSYKVLSNNIGYLKINNFVDYRDFKPYFDSLYPAILKSDGLIIDVRDNFGGATQMTLYVLKHLTYDSIGTVNWKTPRNIAAYKAWGVKNDWFESTGQKVEPFKDRPVYTKPVNVLADESSFSGAEDFCFGFTTIHRGKLIGRSTAGSTGSPLMFNLPDGALVLICTKKDTYPDGTEFVGYGIHPDIEVNKTIEDIRNGNDEALNVALNDIIDTSGK